MIDAHAHITPAIAGRTVAGPTKSRRYGRIRWGDVEFPLLPPLADPTAFTAETLLAYMDWMDVERSVLLQSGFYGDSSEYIASAVARWPDRFVGAGFVDPTAADARAVFLRCVETHGFHIMKFELSVATGLVGLHPALRVAGEELSWLWAECEARDVVVTLDLGAVGSASYQTADVVEVLTRHPRLRVVVAHLAQPPVSDPSDPVLESMWLEQLALARRPNVWFDLSALAGYGAAVEDFPYPTAAGYIRRAIDEIGVGRMLWGTDVPGLLAHATYKQLIRFVELACEDLAPEDRLKIFDTNAREVYLPDG